MIVYIMAIIHSIKGDVNMKLGVYDIINDPLPQLYKIKEINIGQEIFKYDAQIINMFNKHLMMDKLNSEHIYALSLTYGLYPKGIILVSSGTCDKCAVNFRGLAIGLLLTGAEQFMCFHNHPGYNRIISNSDINLTKEYNKLGNTIGINFLRHYMITKNYYTECIDPDLQNIPFI